MIETAAREAETEERHGRALLFDAVWSSNREKITGHIWGHYEVLVTVRDEYGWVKGKERIKKRINRQKKSHVAKVAKEKVEQMEILRNQNDANSFEK